MLRAAGRGRCPRRGPRAGHSHYVVDEANEFEKMVIDYFTSEYRAGRTPNPCVMCNEKLKFGNLLTKARALGATHIATGHYARIERGADGRSTLLKAVDAKKDQSYFSSACARSSWRRRSCRSAD